MKPASICHPHIEFAVQKNYIHIISLEKMIETGRKDYFFFAQTLFLMIGRVCRYRYDTKKWMYYAQNRWIDDNDDSFIQQCVVYLIDQLWGYLTIFLIKKIQVNLTDLETAELESLQGLYDALKDWKLQKSVIAGFQIMRPLQLVDFDRHRNLFNVQNGTLDTETCTLQNHNPEDFITRVAGSAYDMNAQDVQFYQLLIQSFRDKEILKFFFRFLGSALGCVDTNRNILVIKASLRHYFIKLVFGMFGSYCKAISYKDLMQKDHKCQQLLELSGVRLLIIEGIPKNAALDNLLFLVGRYAPLSVRVRGYEEKLVDLPCSVIVITQHEPKLVEGYIFRESLFYLELADWREDDNRVLPSDSYIQSIFLNLALAGLEELRATGSYSPPPDIIALTDELITSGDYIKTFISECFDKDITWKVRTVQVYEEYCQWVKHYKLGKPMSSQGFFKRIRELGIKVDPREKRNRYMHGYRLDYFVRPMKIESYCDDLNFNEPEPTVTFTRIEPEVIAQPFPIEPKEEDNERLISILQEIKSGKLDIDLALLMYDDSTDYLPTNAKISEQTNNELGAQTDEYTFTPNIVGYDDRLQGITTPLNTTSTSDSKSEYELDQILAGNDLWYLDAQLGRDNYATTTRHKRNINAT